MITQNSKNNPNKNLPSLFSTQQGEKASQDSSKVEDETYPLTPHQIEILQQVEQGLTNKEIALRLNCSIQNIEKHLAKIYRSLKASNRAQAVSLAKDRGWLPRNAGGGKENLPSR